MKEPTDDKTIRDNYLSVSELCSRTMHRGQLGAPHCRPTSWVYAILARCKRERCSLTRVSRLSLNFAGREHVTAEDWRGGYVSAWALWASLWLLGGLEGEECGKIGEKMRVAALFADDRRASGEIEKKPNQTSSRRSPSSINTARNLPETALPLAVDLSCGILLRFWVGMLYTIQPVSRQAGGTSSSGIGLHCVEMTCKSRIRTKEPP